MTLSWGRRPYPVRTLPVLFVAVVVLTALLAHSDTPYRTAKVSIIEPDTAQHIQGLLNLHALALERQDLFAYERTLDRRDPEFTRCMLEQLDRGDRRLEELSPNRLIEIEQVGRSVVRAYVQQRDGVVMRYFRRLVVINIWTRPPFDLRTSFDVWYLTTPEPGDISEREEPRPGAREDAC